MSVSSETTRKSLAATTALALLLSLVAIAIPFSGTADANHPAGSHLDCWNDENGDGVEDAGEVEASTNRINRNHVITCQLEDLNGDPVNATTATRINGEVDCNDADCDGTGGDATVASYDGELDGDANDAPTNGDQAPQAEDDERDADPDGAGTECIIAAGASFCQFNYDRNDIGDDLLAFWIDEDQNEATDDSDGAEAPGDDGDNDITDVLSKTWQAPAATNLDCDDANGDATPDNNARGLASSEREGNVVGEDEMYLCTVTDQDGVAFAGATVDGENDAVAGAGAQDPDDPDSNTTGTPDYTCGPTNGAGQCTITVSGTADAGETGTDSICFFIAGSGGACAGETRDENTTVAAGITTDTANDAADRVDKTWAALDLRVDVTPETAGNTLPGDNIHDVQGTLVNQFGEPVAAPSTVTIDFEILTGPNANFGGNPGFRDFECTIEAGNGDCNDTFTAGDSPIGQARYTSGGVNGTDDICGWIDTDGDNVFLTTAGPEDGGLCDDGSEVLPAPTGDATDDTDDNVDRVEKNWVGGTSGNLGVELNCVPETASNPLGATHIVTCWAYDGGGTPVNGTNVAAEASGANDPDGAAPAPTADFACVTGDGSSTQQGNCRFFHNPPGAANPGNGSYRAWIDANLDNLPNEADTAEGRNECTTPGNTAEGVPCPPGPAPAPLSTANGGSNGSDDTDVVDKTWFSGAAQLTMTPDFDDAAIGTCNVFTVTIADTSNPPVPVSGQTVDVRQTHATFGTATTPKGDPGFCTPGAVAAADPSAPNPSGVAEGTDGANTDAGVDGRIAGETTTPTDANGQVSFGVTIDNNVTGDVTVLSYCESGGCPNAADDDNPNTPATGNIQDQSTKTWNPGGGDSVESITVTPPTDSNPNGSTHAFQVLLRNTAGNPVNGITPVFRIVNPDGGGTAPNLGTNTNGSGPNPPGTAPACTATNNNGVSFCAYTDQAGGPTPGTDKIEVWVQQSAASGGGSINRDAGEPFAVANKTWTPPPQNMRLNLICDEPPGTPQSGDALDVAIETAVDCANPLTQQTETFTAIVNNANNTGTTTDDTPAAGVEVTFNITDESGGGGAYPGTAADAAAIGFVPPGGGNNGPINCTTAANGQCSVQVVNTDPDAAEAVDVTANVSGQTNAGAGGNTFDRATKAWQLPRPAILRLTPQSDINQSGPPNQHTVQAQVLTQFGLPAVGFNVDFDIVAGSRNDNGTGAVEGVDRVTDANGIATFTYTDTGSPLTNGLDVIRAWADVLAENDVDNDGPGTSGVNSEPDDDANKNWQASPQVVNTVQIDSGMDDFQDVDPGDPDPNQGAEPPVINPEPDDCPNTPTSPAWNTAGDVAPGGVNTAQEICAAAFDTNGALVVGGSFTFEIIGGTGNFTSPNYLASAPPGTVPVPASGNLGQTVTAQADEGGHAHVFLTSASQGTVTVRVTRDGKTATATYTFGALPRRIDCADPAASSSPGTTTVICTTTDATGAAVPGILVEAGENGVGALETDPANACITAPPPGSTGRMAGFESTTCDISDSAGQVQLVTRTTTASEVGNQSITATIGSPAGGDLAAGPGGAVPDNDAASTDECDRPANNPTAGNAAGQCTDNVGKQWTTPAAPQCSDGMDNDGDGLIDHSQSPNRPAGSTPDPGCSSPDDNTESPDPTAECSDGADNDGDGFIDFGTAAGNDPGCTSADDNSEAPFNDPPIRAECADPGVECGTNGDDNIVAGPDTTQIFCGEGDDNVDASAANQGVQIDCEDDGDKKITGSDFDDQITTGDGDDDIDGAGGDDDIDGGDGNDDCNGGDGDDSINCGAGRDSITGGSGNDDLSSLSGRDTIIGNAGNDVLTGDGGNDNLKGGKGQDVLRGGGKNDTLRGGGGSDTLVGSSGSDDLFGGAGKDNLKGGAGKDTLRGGKGRDVCRGGGGRDRLRSCERGR